MGSKRIVPGTNAILLNSDGTLLSQHKVLVQPLTNTTTTFQVLDADGGTPVLSVDTIDERVGIGTAAPTNPLNIIGPIGNDAEHIPLVFERRTTGTAGGQSSFVGRAVSTGDMVDGFGPRFRFEIKDDADNNRLIGTMEVTRDGADNSGKFDLFTYDAGAKNASSIHIGSNSYVGINQTSPAAMLQVNTPASTVIGLIVRGFASQSESLFRLLNSGGGVVVSSGDCLAGSEWVHNAGGIDIDFRVESENIDNIFVVNAANDQVETNGGRIKSTTRIDDGDSPYTTLNTDDVLFCDTDGGAITVELQAGVDGRRLRIINCGSSGNDVTIDGDGAEEIRGELTQALADGEILILVYESAESWW